MSTSSSESSSSGSGGTPVDWTGAVAGGSAINSNDLVGTKVYPPASPDSSSSGVSTDRTETYRYNRQAQVRGLTDPNQTAHIYLFDRLGRLTDDLTSVPLASAIDDTVARIERIYDENLRLAEVNSWGEDSSSSSSGDPVPLNRVVLAYDGFGQLASDKQCHDGHLAHGKTVAYSYENGGGNTIRRTAMTYTDGSRQASYVYEGTIDDKLGRVSGVKFDSATKEAAYSYLGLGRVAAVRYANMTTPFEFNYEVDLNGGTNDGGDKYTGLDRFGRISGEQWFEDDDPVVEKQFAQYGYERASNRTWRRDTLAHDGGGSEATKHDNYYWYDGLYQVARRKLGNLTGTPYSNIDNVQQDEQWCFDETGNWNRYDSSADSLNQSRTHNPCNQITNITGPSGVADPLHDDAGNMTYGPSPSGWTTGYTMVWDAWNRLVRVKQGATVVADYAYDGLARRITKTIGANVRHYYYDDRWRAVDEYAGATNDRRYLWGADSRYRMVLRQRRISSGLSDERLYVLYDAMDPVALAEQDGDIAERFQYSPFGITTFLNADFSVRTAGTSFAWDFLFHAEFRDAETGYYNYGYRYYHPQLGRWLSRDPIGERGGLNLYWYLGNKGVNRHDWFGLIDLKFINEINRKTHNCLGYACMGGEPGYYAYPSKDGPNKDASTKDAIEKHGWKCKEVKKHSACECEKGEERILVTIYKNENKGNTGKDPWDDPSFDWETGGNDLTDLHAIYSPTNSGIDDFSQVPKVGAPINSEINWELFMRKKKDPELLCCCRSAARNNSCSCC